MVVRFWLQSPSEIVSTAQFENFEKFVVISQCTEDHVDSIKKVSAVIVCTFTADPM